MRSGAGDVGDDRSGILGIANLRFPIECNSGARCSIVAQPRHYRHDFPSLFTDRKKSLRLFWRFCGMRSGAGDVGDDRSGILGIANLRFPVEYNSGARCSLVARRCAMWRHYRHRRNGSNSRNKDLICDCSHTRGWP